MTPQARDVGLAVERTALAWRRTAVSAMVCCALFLNHALTSGWRPAQAAPLGSGAAMAALAVLCYVRNRALREGNLANSRTVVAAATLAVVAVACVAATIGVTMPDP
ncbi:DUF202 domain-containing protein [Nocardia sp. NPDC050712]|uniref:DUF202 domain-containing protein n=1 Tax=Nocardia sp. NPDC050712 TaxID=3155518 RepID=UPI0033DE920F